MATVSSIVPSAVTIVINHAATNTNHVIRGYSTDSTVSIEYPDDTWTEEVGVDGDTTRIHRLDKTVRATISLAQGSRSNDVLSALMRQDERDLSGRGMFTCTITDKSGRSYYNSSQTFVKRPNTQEFGQASNTRDWVLVLSWADQWVGGNDLIDPDTQQTLENLGITVDDQWILGNR